jgi:putative photosynthetic complex assembly protein 2
MIFPAAATGLGTSDIALSALYAVFVWWFSTGLLLLMVRLPRPLHLFVMGGFTLITIGALFGLQANLSQVSTMSAVAGFTYAILIWAWLELSFLYGFLTGPRRIGLDEGTTGFARFRAAFAAVAYHEVAILVALVGIMVLSHQAENQVALLAFLVLFFMRISAKLNLFFGAPNLSPEFLPEHLKHLASYFEVSRISRFFPVSVTLASLAFGFSVHATLTASTPYSVIAMTLVSTLLGLAILEHWFLVLPIRDAALWRWALGSKPAPAKKPAALPPLAAPPIDRAARVLRPGDTHSRTVHTAPLAGRYDRRPRP